MCRQLGHLVHMAFPSGAGGKNPTLLGRAGTGKVVCIVSGGNIDSSRLGKILAGETPT